MNNNVFKRKIKVIEDDYNNEADLEHPKQEKIINHYTNHIGKDNVKINGNASKTSASNEENDTSRKLSTNKDLNQKQSDTKKLNLGEKIKLMKKMKEQNLKQLESPPKSFDRKEDKNKNSVLKERINDNSKSLQSKINKLKENESLNSKKNKSSHDQRKDHISTNKKRRRSESSEESESDSEESEDGSYSSDEGESEESVSSDSSEEKNSSPKPKKKSIPNKSHNKNNIKNQSSPTKQKSKKSEKVLKTKDSLVTQLLKRWWYALPKWPPEDYDPTEKLNELKLRLVDKSEWKIEPITNDKGSLKCIELDGYKFVYIDPYGKLHDLRPKETMPSYNNFILKSEKELYLLLIKSLNNQLQELQTNKYSSEDSDLIKSLKEELHNAETNYSKIK